MRIPWTYCVRHAPEGYSDLSRYKTTIREGTRGASASARAVLFENMVELKIFILKCSEDREDAIRRSDSLIMQKVKQAEASEWAGFGLFGDIRKALLDDEAEIKTRYARQEVKAMRNHGFSGVNLKERADRVQVRETYNIIYRNFSRNVHSSDYVEHIRMLQQAHKCTWSDYKELRDAVGFRRQRHFSLKLHM